MSDQDAPIVSVVIGAYNGAEFLEASVESVLRQTFEDFELVDYDSHPHIKAPVAV